MEKFFELEEYAQIEVLQNIQDSFANSLGMGAVIVDYKGEPITKESNFTKFCTYIRNNDELKGKCYKCDAYGGVQSAITKKPHIYKCHAGLVDFAIPIMANNTYIGAILGGQVRLKEDLKEENNVLKDKYNEELSKYYKDIKIKTYEEVKYAADLMYQISNYILNKDIVKINSDFNSNKAKIDRATNIELIKEYNLESEQYSEEIHKALNYIHSNIKKNITLEEVANHINLSPNYLSKTFKKDIGINFITYITNKKIALAKEMLKDTDTPILNISIDLSFNKPNYFSKVFKKIVGLTPSEYRNTLQNDQIDT
ncbi:PocR ligand-binding domain-containing protein [Romboutsia hominis]|uniref:Regulatory protein PocR n=1 Tax=Romboutsia hominis TaxID=1507512 RepID=A0A2P2BQY7_9FIRM|nr:PocR ligand-binding domain-containing protein [Romboutsia hominis]CEI72778.1 Regulatory protein PocR [Romboutsia hominis]